MLEKDVSVDTLTRTYIKIREKRAELSSEFKKSDDALQMQLEKVKTTLLNYCKEQGVESVRTSEGIFYRSVKTRYWTSDWEAMHDFVKTHDALELLEKRISQSALQEFLEDNPDLPKPEGLKAKSEYTLSVRKK